MVNTNSEEARMVCCLSGKYLIFYLMNSIVDLHLLLMQWCMKIMSGLKKPPPTCPNLLTEVDLLDEGSEVSFGFTWSARFMESAGAPQGPPWFCVWLTSLKISELLGSGATLPNGSSEMDNKSTRNTRWCSWLACEQAVKVDKVCVGACFCVSVIVYLGKFLINWGQLVQLGNKHILGWWVKVRVMWVSRKWM